MMNDIRRIPVRTRRAGEERAEPDNGTARVVGSSQQARPLPPSTGRRPADSDGGTAGTREHPPADAGREQGDGSLPAKVRDEQVDWQDRALRLQAEMENYRRRQQRLAQDQIQAERERLLQALLEIVDDLERALATPSRDGGGLHEGVQLTHRAALQRLKKEGVEQIEAQDRPFDPAWHDAVSTVPGRQWGIAPDTVVKVLEPGYRLGDRLLRPARVVVAV
jgi:molecular chaperone GrpE